MSTKANQQAVFMSERRWLSISWSSVRRALLFLASAGVLAWLGSVMQDPTTLPINKIHALGTFTMVNESMLREVVAKTVSGGYFNLNVDEVQKAVEALPWVYQANVSRVWPDTIAISVTEQTALASWAMGGMVNTQGTLFKPTEITRLLTLPVFDGPAGMERNMTEFYTMAKSIIDPLGLNIRQLSMDSRRAYRLTLNNGIVVLLGRENMQDRLKRFARVYKKVLANRAQDIARVDTRYSNGLAIGWNKKIQN